VLAHPHQNHLQGILEPIVKMYTKLEF
jgi:hypothetical protein